MHTNVHKCSIARLQAGDQAGVLPGSGAGASGGAAGGVPPGEDYKEGGTSNSSTGAGGTLHSHTWTEEDSSLGWKKENLCQMMTLSCSPINFYVLVSINPIVPDRLAEKKSARKNTN